MSSAEGEGCLSVSEGSRRHHKLITKPQSVFDTLWCWESFFIGLFLTCPGGFAASQTPASPVTMTGNKRRLAGNWWMDSINKYLCLKFNISTFGAHWQNYTIQTQRQLTVSKLGGSHPVLEATIQPSFLPYRIDNLPALHDLPIRGVVVGGPSCCDPTLWQTDQKEERE